MSAKTNIGDNSKKTKKARGWDDTTVPREEPSCKLKLGFLYFKGA